MVTRTGFPESRTEQGRAEAMARLPTPPSKSAPMASPTLRRWLFAVSGSSASSRPGRSSMTEGRAAARATGRARSGRKHVCPGVLLLKHRAALPYGDFCSLSATMLLRFCNTPGAELQLRSVDVDPAGLDLSSVRRRRSRRPIVAHVAPRFPFDPLRSPPFVSKYAPLGGVRTDGQEEHRAGRRFGPLGVRFLSDRVRRRGLIDCGFCSVSV